MRIVSKAIRFIRYLGFRVFIHSVMEELRGRKFKFYNEERILDDNRTLGYETGKSKKSFIHDLKPISELEYRVSIIIPSDNLDNITECVEKIVENTSFPNYEIVVVTNSETARQLETFRIPNSEFRIQTYDKPYNFSDKCNEGATFATGDVLCFYNDDVYPLDLDWLYQMLNALSLPDVGGVTPLQMSDMNTVLSAGSILGSPGLQTSTFTHIPYTPLRNLKPDKFIIRDVSVLSGACLLLEKDFFNEIGKFNAVDTPNSFSDTEISLKIREAGYRCVITPDTRVMHDNRVTWRKTDKPDKAFLYMIEKWGKYFTKDVFFSDSLKILYEIPSPPHIYKYHAPANIMPRKPGRRDILFVCHDLTYTGAPLVLMDMVKTVIENGDWPVVIGLIDGPLRQIYLNMGITVIIDNSICNDTEASKFAFDYVARNFDLVIVNTIVCWRFINILGNSLPPVIWWIHESSSIADVFKEFLPKKPDINITAFAVSEYCANSLRAAGISYDFGILAYGISDFASGVKQIGHQEMITFLMIGAFEHHKAHDILFNAIELIDGDTILRAKFILIGATDDLEVHGIRSLTKKYDNIEVHSSMPRENLLEWHKRADCLIVPSREDSLPVVATEAMIFSKPVICSDNTGTASYITQYENGIVFPSEDSKALAEHITFAIENREKMAEMGRKARKEIYEKYFTMDIFKQNTLEIIDKVAVKLMQN